MSELLLLIAGLIGGAINTLAGGGSFIVFPALLAVGVPPVLANASNTYAALPGYDANTWGGILAPAGTPKDIVARLNGEINKALAAEDVRKKLSEAGIEIQGGTPQRFADYIKAEVAKWGKVTAEAGIQAE